MFVHKYQPCPVSIYLDYAGHQVSVAAFIVTIIAVVYCCVLPLLKIIPHLASASCMFKNESYLIGLCAKKQLHKKNVCFLSWMVYWPSRII